MLRGVFVTGTDTGVGKTVVSAALMVRYGHGRAVRYWKPVQTGIEHDDDTRTVEQLAGCRVLEKGVRLPRPLSPHLAARLAGQPIDVDALVSLAASCADTERFVVEGAGGVLVPLTPSVLVIDLIERLGLPAVVVARTTLGTINHTLMTMSTLRARGIAVPGVLLDGPANAENQAAIEHYGDVPVLGHLPPLEPLTRDALAPVAQQLDPHGRLSEFLTP
ncbi:MAG: dethiobiotin synthase [Vicinamibacterales bacterium]